MEFNGKSPLNPSTRAMARVKDPLPIPVTCEHCGSHVDLKRHREIYKDGQEFGDWPFNYVCRGCGARVGLHPYTPYPLGSLATEAMRDARKRCKAAFENLWRGPRAVMTRREAYDWLASQLGIEPAQCHWGLFDVALCERAKVVCVKQLHQMRTQA